MPSSNAAAAAAAAAAAMSFNNNSMPLQQLNPTRDLAAAYVPCHIQNMATPYFAAAAAAANSARQHQMPAALSIFPSYQGSYFTLVLL